MQDGGSEGYGAQLCQITPTERRGEGHTCFSLHTVLVYTTSLPVHTVLVYTASTRHTGLVYILHPSLHMALVHTMSLPAQGTGLYRILPYRQLASWLHMLLLLFLLAWLRPGGSGNAC